jgi:arylsulfatase A-like enzyme
VYGYGRATSPFIDRLAREGVQLLHAYAPVPTTVPSHISMLTGLPPHVHGASRNQYPITREDVPSLPAFLRARGYDTAAFLSVGFLDPRGKGLPGFAHVECPPVGLVWRSHETFARAAAWMRAHAEEPFFLWIHSYDPHAPYDPLPPYDTLFWSEAPEPYAAPHSGVVGAAPPTPRQAAFTNAMYDGEIRGTDAALEQFFAAMAAVLPAPPLVIVTGDHGEVLDEHAHDMGIVYSHGRYPYHQALSVPFIARWPGNLPPARSTAPIDITGIAPTVVALLFGEAVAADEFPAMAPSFADVLRGTAARDGAPLFAFSPKVTKRSKFVPGKEFRLHESWSVLRWPWHLIHNPGRGSSLFDVEQDPLELRDVAALHPERTAALEAEVIRHFTEIPRAREADGPVDEKLMEQLRSLGYVD